MIRREMKFKGKFALRVARGKTLGGMYFKEKWENESGESGIEWTRVLYEARTFETYKHAAAMANRLIDHDIPTWIVKVEDERKRLQKRGARRQ